MRILILSQWFDPEPTFKGLYFARELHARGHQVEVLTGFPNYPSGRLYPGYRIRPWQNEVTEGIPVHRLPLYPSHDGSALRRAANYLSFAASTALLGPWMITRPDVVYVCNLVSLSLTTEVLRLFRGQPAIVYDVLDLWPESVTQSGMVRSGLLRDVLGMWSSWAYRRADLVVGHSPGISASLLGRGLEPGRVTTIYNWCDERAIRQSSKDEALARRLGLDHTFNVMYAGNMGAAQGLETVLGAAERLQVSRPAVRFVLVGDGTENTRLKSIAGARGLGNVVFVPRQPASRMGPILSIADALIVHLKDHPLFRITIPSKTQTYLAMGIPIIMAVRGDAADLVHRSGGGVLCQPGDPASIAEAVARLCSMPESDRRKMGEAGRRFYYEELSLERGVTRWEECFARAADGRRRTGE